MTAKTCRRVLFGSIAFAALGLAAMSMLAQAQTPPPGQNPVCARLEAQLVAFDRGTADGGRLEQLKKLEEAANKQQFELDRLSAQMSRSGCEGSGFFLFGSAPPQCGPLNAQRQQMRAGLDRIQAEAERLRHSGSEREGQRRGLIMALAQNDCGQQYRAAAATQQPRGFLETLFGGIPSMFGNNPILAPPPGSDSIIPGIPIPSASGSYRTVCVRTCDGYYFPVSYATSQSRFLDDEKVCQRTCPAAEVALYAHRNPGADINQAMSISGRPYTELPNAFLYRKEYVAACSCKRQGESWAQALKNLDTRATLDAGDILVDDQRAKLMSQPRVDAQGRPIRIDPRSFRADAKAQSQTEPPTSAITEGSEQPDRNRKVRSVGPTFLPVR